MAEQTAAERGQQALADIQHLARSDVGTGNVLVYLTDQLAKAMYEVLAEHEALVERVAALERVADAASEMVTSIGWDQHGWRLRDNGGERLARAVAALDSAP